MRNLLKTLGYINNIKRGIIALIILNVIAAAIGAIQPYTFKLIIDSLVSITESTTTAQVATPVLAALGLMLGIRLLNIGFSYVNNVNSLIIYQRIITATRTSIFERLTKLSLEYFEKERIGAISQRYSGSTSDVARWAYTSFSMLLPQIMSVTVILVVLFLTDVLVGLITVVAITLFFATQMPVLKRLKPILKEAHQEMETATAYFNETVSHIATVRAFGGESNALTKQLEALQRREKLMAQREVKLQLSIAARQLIYALTIVGAIYIIVQGVVQGRHTPGDVLLVALYLQQIQSSLWPIGRLILDTAEADASAERIVEMLETKPTVVDAPDAVKLDRLNSIEFKNVSFTYPGKKARALDSVSFKIEPGQTLALVGPSGTGKTTITKLMLRFYEPTSGQIYINDQPIEHFTQESIRSHIGVVMQDVALFNDTIQVNLQLANPGAKRADLRTAATQAHADAFIEKLPDKYQTMVGERGVKLSGGEKQRVAIARAILKDPQLIILDEATSALDSESEAHVQAGLHRLMDGRTGVVIAHRLSTVMRADQIIVLKNGKVVERGQHTELAARRGGLYAKLFKLQTEGLNPNL